MFHIPHQHDFWGCATRALIPPAICHCLTRTHLPVVWLTLTCEHLTNRQNLEMHSFLTRQTLAYPRAQTLLFVLIDDVLNALCFSLPSLIVLLLRRCFSFLLSVINGIEIVMKKDVKEIRKLNPLKRLLYIEDYWLVVIRHRATTFIGWRRWFIIVDCLPIVCGEWRQTLTHIPRNMPPLLSSGGKRWWALTEVWW